MILNSGIIFVFLGLFFFNSGIMPSISGIKTLFLGLFFNFWDYSVMTPKKVGEMQDVEVGEALRWRLNCQLEIAKACCGSPDSVLIVSSTYHSPGDDEIKGDMVESSTL